MAITSTFPPIPYDTALQLCIKIRSEHRMKWWTFAHWQCWGCVKLSQQTSEQKCFASAPGRRGCQLVNERYDRSVHAQR